ncbi:MAG: DUF4935 domain-containing protein [Clostridia bacterium]|nr:DUF4935 domain-containing protein [Clostridia bacterium]
MRKAFVFDTNFIIQTKKLDEVIENLKEQFTVYVTQVSIDERIAQQCRELKSLYENIDAIINDDKYKHIVTIKIKKSFEEKAEQYSQSIQENYNKTFGENIIPLKKDADTLDLVLYRANNKQPPFLNVQNASDKGFKDCLLWLSIITFFEERGEEEVVFVTEDSGFLKTQEFLSKEFKSRTGKQIEFKPNSYYKELLATDNVPKEVVVKETFDANKLRVKINRVIKSLCYKEEIDDWGEPYYIKAFTTSKKIDHQFIEIIFNNLNQFVKDHIFNENVFAEDVFGVDDRIANGDVKVNMEDLAEARDLYNDILKNYPDYIQPFYSVAIDVFNENYVYQPPMPFEFSDGDLPF